MSSVLSEMLGKMEMNVSVGGWRQWFELGMQKDAKLILSACSDMQVKSQKVRALEEMLKFFLKTGLLENGGHEEVKCVCAKCEGFGCVEDGMDDVTCGSCEGTGQVWSGRLSKHSKSLEALTEKYLSIRLDERREMFLEILRGSPDG